jgi:HEAT repeat protein
MRKLLALLSSVVIAGCFQAPPPPPPPPTTTTVTAVPIAPASPKPQLSVTPNPSIPANTDSTTARPAATSGNVRDAAAKYLKKNADGIWVPDELAATELEKFAAANRDQLLPLLADEQVEVRRGAAFFLLTDFNPNVAAEVSAFAKLLSDGDPSTRGFGVSAAMQMHPEDQAKLAPQLAEMLNPAREDKPNNRVAIIRLLAKLTTEASPVADKIAASAQDDPDPNARKAALVAIVQVAAPPDAVAALATGLTDADAGVRLVAAARLRQLGIVATPATKQLVAALGDNDERVANAAAEALVKVGATAVEPLVEQLSGENIAARKLALACLAKIGKDAASAAPAIEKLLQDADPQTRELAAAALARVKAP